MKPRPYKAADYKRDPAAVPVGPMSPIRRMMHHLNGDVMDNPENLTVVSTASAEWPQQSNFDGYGNWR